ncbi:MAG: hypothetical protein J7L45_01035 [Candidatus Aenigmarchaeota archaeon]|nr:hypothetical protein [Candidatus Aenigmarchaeota archaeon]
MSDIKEGIKILQKMEEIRKKGNIPVIVIKSLDQAKKLSKQIEFKDEVIYLKEEKRDLLSFLIEREPRAIIGDLSEPSQMALNSKGIDYIPKDEVDLKIEGSYGELESEEEIILDMEIVDKESGGVLQSGKLIIPLIKKKVFGIKENDLKKLEKIVVEGGTMKKEEEKKGAEKGKALAKELDLIDLKSEFLKPEEKKKAEKKEEGETKKKEKKHLFGFFKKREKKKSLKEATLENLSKVKSVSDEEKAAVLIAHVLKQFLEVKLKSVRELTYLELIKKLKAAHLPIDYANQIIKFYEDMIIQEYKGEKRVDVKEAYSLAEKVINDLS